MKAVVLAAGKGAHLGELTKDRPKPMIEIGGKPILEYVLQGLKSAGINEVIIVIGYKGELIKKYFGNETPYGLRLQYQYQAVQDGTGSALNSARREIGKSPFLLAYGDIITEAKNFIKLRQTFDGSKTAGLIGVTQLSDPTRGAAVYFDNNRQIYKIVEKPSLKTTRSKWTFAGLSVLTPVVFEYTERLVPSARGEFDLTQAFQLMIEANLHLQAYILEGVWMDFSTPAEIQASATMISNLTAIHS
ncbi:MAG: nucleotidyltransferase family protein [Candidatus Sumerlaeia bacterium]|nr:nucleotidyltransferase family protein [Candidatus Sumerlaeia bacterium]